LSALAGSQMTALLFYCYGIPTVHHGT